MPTTSRPWRRAAVRVVGLLAASAALGACGTADGFTSPLTPGDRPDAFRSLAIKQLRLAPLSGLSGPSWTMSTGDEALFGYTASDAKGGAVTGRPAVYRVTRQTVPGMVRIDSVSGQLRAFAAGTFQVNVTVSGVTSPAMQFAVVGATVVDTAVAAPSAPASPDTTSSAPPSSAPPSSTTTVPIASTAGVPPAGAGSVALAVRRFDGGAGTQVVVSSGVPLAPGALFPGQEGRVRVVVGAEAEAAEAAVYAAGLHSRHADGSLRAVLVQFRVASLGAAAAVPARLELAAGARPAALTLAAPLAAAAPAVPGGAAPGVALPTDPAYLVAADLVGPTGTSAAARALGGPYARYEEDFRAYADRHWQTEGARWEGNYYDRALIYYAWWARTGEATYWWRATQQAATYRREYLEANPADPYKPSPHWAQLEGLEKHYLLTGDETSRAAVVRVADVLNLFNPSYMTRAVGEGRIAARVVHSALLAWRLTPAGAPWPAGAEGADWGARLERHLAAVFAWQQPDGSYPADGQVCGGQLNYMVGLLNDALIKTHLYYRPAGRAPDARVEPAVRRAADYLWRTQWVAAAESFQYASVPCGMNLQGFSVGGPEPAPDLNGLLVTTFGWLSTQGADAAARAEQRARADQVFAGGVARAWLSGSKQFNEHYSASFKYFGYR